MRGTHWGILGMALGAVALQLQNLHDWHQALTPQFVSAAILSVGATFAGIKSDPPPKEDTVPVPRP